MIHDPFYREIIEGLNGRLDPELFERCASDLLRADFPTLVPVRGGSDGGMDGAIADGRGKPIPLICTTGQDYVSNLAGSLDSYKKHSKRTRAVFVSSRELSGEDRKKLHDKAGEKGFVLIHICDQAGIANLLYHRPEWCLELLRITGAPPRLSLLPLTKRPLGEQPLIGREKDLKWLQETQGDLVLVGQPGSGKTYLMYMLARMTGALFVVSEDRQEIANGIRAQKPTALLIDDAHLNPRFLSSLVQLRKEVGGDFRIIANCWPGAQDDVRSHLGVANDAVRSLELLSRDDILQVIKATDIAGPRELLNELLDQAEGRPGLAVTLSRLCLRGDVQDIALGDALARDIGTTFRPLVGDQAVHTLAVFAVGGDAGMQMQDVATYMGLPLVEVRTIVTQLAAGGVLLERQMTLSVRPSALRHALIRDTFFSGATQMPIDGLLEKADPTDAARSLIGAKARGAKFPDEVLHRLLEQTSSADAWQEYASMGADESNWVLETHPEKIATVARQTLYHYPKGAIPLLLGRAVGDNRALNSHPDHSLRLIEDWVEGATPRTDDVMKRRNALLEAALAWSDSGCDNTLVLKALTLSLSPGYDFSHSEPGSGRTFTFGMGCVAPEDIVRIEGNWPRVLGFLREKQPSNWKPITSMVENYIFRLHAISGHVPEGSSEAMRAFGWRMLEDLVRIAGDRIGVLHWSRHVARRDGRKIEVQLDPDFETIFPPDEDRFLHGDAEKKVAEEASKVAERWSQEDPKVVVNRYMAFREAAETYDCWPRLDNYVFSKIASITADPQPWIEALLDAQVPGFLSYGFLQRLSNDPQDTKVQATLLRCISCKDMRDSAVQIILTMKDPPENLLTAALGNLEGMALTVQHLAWDKKIPDEQMRLLLRHDDSVIAAGAAIGEWYGEPSGSVRPLFEEDWKAAITQCKSDDHSLWEIFEARPDAALAWLTRHLQTTSEFDFDFHTREIAEDAMRVLTKEQRLELLRKIPADRWWDDMIREIVGRDHELYRFLLDTPELESHHLVPLRGHPQGEAWVRLATMALDAGHQPERIVGATRGGIWSWSGDESQMWQSWVEAYDALQTHTDPRFREIGRIGFEYTKGNQDRALKEEHHENVYGIH